uniref:Uncharacterized protein n=1 Tax=Oryza meridionalis TaxID=40149 RepID=A0A0E0DYW3_9ORYZ
MRTNRPLETGMIDVMAGREPCACACCCQGAWPAPPHLVAINKGLFAYHLNPDQVFLYQSIRGIPAQRWERMTWVSARVARRDGMDPCRAKARVAPHVGRHDKH